MPLTLASPTPPQSPVVTIRNISRHCQMFSGGSITPKTTALKKMKTIISTLSPSHVLNTNDASGFLVICTEAEPLCYKVLGSFFQVSWAVQNDDAECCREAHSGFLGGLPNPPDHISSLDHVGSFSVEKLLYFFESMAVGFIIIWRIKREDEEKLFSLVTNAFNWILKSLFGRAS